MCFIELLLTDHQKEFIVVTVVATKNKVRINQWKRLFKS